MVERLLQVRAMIETTVSGERYGGETLHQVIDMVARLYSR